MEERVSGEKTIKAQRKEFAYALKESPSLQAKLRDAEWYEVIWARAVAIAASETGLEQLPDDCLWPVAKVLDAEFWP